MNRAQMIACMGKPREVTRFPESNDELWIYPGGLDLRGNEKQCPSQRARAATSLRSASTIIRTSVAKSVRGAQSSVFRASLDSPMSRSTSAGR